MYGIITDKKIEPFISLDDYISIGQMNYFENEYFPKQFDKFCYNLPKIISKSKQATEHWNQQISIYGEVKKVPHTEPVYLFNKLMSTYYGDWIEREEGWKLIKTYIPEFVEYLKDNVVDYFYDFFIKYEIKGNPMIFHRDFGADTSGEKGIEPDEEEYRSSSAVWTWFRFSDSKKLYVSDFDGKDDVSKRIPLDAYGAMFNGRDYHGCYDDSYGYSSRIYATLKQKIIDDNNIDVSNWDETYPPKDFMKELCLK